MMPSHHGYDHGYVAAGMQLATPNITVFYSIIIYVNMIVKNNNLFLKSNIIRHMVYDAVSSLAWDSFSRPVLLPNVFRLSKYTV